MTDPARRTAPNPPRAVPNPVPTQRRVVGYNRRTGEALVRLEDGSLISVDGAAIPDWLAEEGFQQGPTRPGTADVQTEPRFMGQDHPRPAPMPAPPPMPMSEAGTTITRSPGGSVGFSGPGSEAAFLAEIMSRGEHPPAPAARPAGAPVTRVSVR